MHILQIVRILPATYRFDAESDMRVYGGTK